MKTHKTNKLYHQFLKSRNGTPSMLGELIEALIESGFIVLVGDQEYQETTKLASRNYSKELYRIVGKTIEHNKKN